MDQQTQDKDVVNHAAGERAAAEADSDRDLSAWQIVFSSLAAGFGVQSSRNRKRDFSRGRAIHFVIAGLVLTTGFVLVMVTIVNLVLSAAQG